MNHSDDKENTKKTFKYNDDLHLALLALRTSLPPTSNTASAVLLYNRPVRTIIPSLNTRITIKARRFIEKAILMNIIKVIYLN